MSLISKKRRKRNTPKSPPATHRSFRPGLPHHGIGTHTLPQLGALSVIQNQPNLSNIDLTRRGPAPCFEDEDRPEQYERYRGKVSARVLMHLCAAVPEMRSISLRGCRSLDRTVLRSLSTSDCGDTITGLDLSDSSLNGDSIQVLGHFNTLHDLDLSRTTINDNALQWVVEGSFRTLRQLAMSQCTQITDVGIEWIAGMCGFSPKPCRQIMMLDLGRCPRIGDRALAALGRGCPRLRSLNLEYNKRVTDYGMNALTTGCREIRVLVLRHLGALTNRTLTCLGKRSPHLRSLCVDFCIQMGDQGVEKMASGCPKLECASFAGCLNVSERSVCAIAAGCLNLMALNVTGCQGVTENGLINLCIGNGYLDVAISYFGLKPKRDCEMMKVRTMEKEILILAATKIQSMWQCYQGKKRYQRQHFLLCIIPSAIFLQRSYRKYLWRKRIKTWLWNNINVRHQAAIIQKWWRQQMAGTWAIRDKLMKEAQARYDVLVADIQSKFRGRNARRLYPCREVPDHFEWLRKEKIKKTRYDAASTLQRVWMGKLCRLRFLSKCEEMNQRKRDIAWGILAIQCSWRCCVARAELTRLRIEWAKKMAKEIAAALLAQRVWRGRCGRKIAQKKRHDREVLYLIKCATATKLQGIYRGWMSRKATIMQVGMEIIAATKIQALYRMFSCPPQAVWATRFAKKRILFNSALEAKQREVDAAKTREDFKASLLKDSASEDSEGDDWGEFWNDEKDAPFWYSHEKRVTTFSDPHGREFEVSLIGRKCKVRWPRSLDERARFDEWGNRMKPKWPKKENDVEVWYDGVILSYHVDKDKHKIYFTGSMQENRPPDVVYNRDWICLKDYPHRVQIQVEVVVEEEEEGVADGSAGGGVFGDERPEGAYCMYQMLASDMRKERREMIERMRRERRGEVLVVDDPVMYLGDGEDGDEEWETFIDEESGASYQYNHVTGESVWE